ncbi:MAG: bacteriophage holin [Pseudonocardiaceae bacterium]
MPYLVSLLIVVTAVVVLVILLARLGRPARRLTGTARLCRAYLADRVGLLSARVAALKVALRHRRCLRDGGGSGVEANRAA